MLVSSEKKLSPAFFVRSIGFDGSFETIFQLTENYNQVEANKKH